MKLLDLFCGAGGAAMGYSRAGFDEIVGVDVKPQPRYPFTFVQGDALEYLAAHGHEFDAIHASPPCQGYLNEHFRVTPSGHVRRDHPKLIADTRARLDAIGKPYVIENIESARKEMRTPITLCGTSFGLPLKRHRCFEVPFLMLTLDCAHLREPKYPTQFRPKKGQAALACHVQVYGNGKGARHWPAAMGIGWMRREELAQAIPPAYTEYIGRQLLEHVTSARAPLVEDSACYPSTSAPPADGHATDRLRVLRALFPASVPR
jgi:DNA (cytosine-5)-methyltransferase 1